jgi:hypothetical protein
MTPDNIDERKSYSFKLTLTRLTKSIKDTQLSLVSCNSEDLKVSFEIYVIGKNGEKHRTNNGAKTFGRSRNCFPSTSKWRWPDFLTYADMQANEDKYLVDGCLKIKCDITIFHSVAIYKSNKPMHTGFNQIIQFNIVYL